jgi:uncharacterized protein (TIGR02246 family)
MMRRSILTLLGAGFAVGAFACGPPPQQAESIGQESPSYEADKATLTELVEVFDAGMNAGDADAIVALFVDDGAASMPPNAPNVYGRENLRAFYEEFFAQGAVAVDNQVEEIFVDGDLAVSFGTYTLTVTPEGGEAMSDSGKWVAASQRQADGSWRTLRNAWSSELPLQEM